MNGERVYEMTKKEFSKAKRCRYKTRNLTKAVKFYKKLRHRKARRNGVDIYKTSSAWDIS